jgi:hypothetical protein
MLRHAVIAFSNVRYRIFKNVFLKVAIWPPFRLQNYKKIQYGFQKGEKKQSKGNMTMGRYISNSRNKSVRI